MEYCLSQFFKFIAIILINSPLIELIFFPNRHSNVFHFDLFKNKAHRRYYYLFVPNEKLQNVKKKDKSIASKVAENFGGCTD